MKISYRLSTPAIFSLFILTFASCSPKAEANPASNAEITAEAPSSSAQTPENGASSDIAGLAKLGFHVFPEPQSLSAFIVPALAGQDGASGSLDSESLAGKVTILNFWATWCPPCKREMPSIQRLHDLMKGTDFRIAAISTGEKETTVSAFIAAAGYTFPVYLDGQGKLGQIYASQGIPTTYILDKTGKVVAGIVGSREYDDPEFVAILSAMAAQ